MADRPRLTDWSSDVYSQGGEDGMLAEVLRRLGIERGTCVEVGAHDGFTYSNTARLWHDQGWIALLVEPDPARFEVLTTRAAGHDCRLLRRAVAAEGPDRLEHLLADVGVGAEVDLLSIDVDGDDLALLRSLPPVRARVVVCEYNPTIPWHLELEGDHGAATGSSLGALVAGAEAVGYALVGVTATNAVFVAETDLDAFADLERDVAALARPGAYTYVITDYTGRAAVVGALPFRYRPGRPAFDRALVRSDVGLRWTPAGAVGAVRWKAGNVVRRLRAMPARDAAALALSRIRHRRRV